MNDSQIIKESYGRDAFSQTAGYDSLSELKAALDFMKSEDVQNVDPDSLSELDEIRIEESLTVEAKIVSLLRQTKNPYCFKYNGMIVKTSFAGKQSIEDCLAECFFGNR